jgi:hypothetical protein
MKSLFVTLSLCLSVTAQARYALDKQSQMAERIEQIGAILIRNDTKSPVEFSRADVGKILYCPSPDLKVLTGTILTERSFKGQQTVLVGCQDGYFIFVVKP